MNKAKSMIEKTLGVLENKQEILNLFFEEYSYEQKIRTAHHSDSEIFAQTLFKGKKEQDEIFLKALERNFAQLQENYSDNKIIEIISWLQEEGTLDQKKEKDIFNLLNRQPKHSKNFVAQQIAADIEKEFLFKQAKLDSQKYQGIYEIVLKIKDMYTSHHKLGFLDEEKI